jgi:hypothetical protein
MATHDYIISNASGASVRADLNNALAAIVSNNSNATSPATTYAYQWWADTTTGQLKLRNSANSAWITIFELDGTMLMEDGSVSAPGLAFASDLNTGFFRSAADKINFATGGAERLEIGDSEVVFNDPSNDVDFRVESNGQSHMLFVDAGNDRVGIGSSSPSFPLTVQSDSGTNSIAVLGRSADDISSTLFYENDGTTQIGRLQARQSYFQISGTDNTKGIFIDNAGEVGIGTDSPTTMLNVEYGALEAASLHELILNANFGTSNNGGGRIGITFSGNPDGTAGAGQKTAGVYGVSTDSTQFTRSMGLVFNTSATDANSSEKLRIDSAGNVGIGTSSPTGYIHIEGTGTGTETYGRFTTGSANGDQSLVIKSGSSRDHMAIQVSTNAGANDDLSLQPDGGNVGIGTTSPGEELVVRADAPSIQLESSNASGRNYGVQADNSGKFHIYDGTAGSNRITLDSAGKVGVGVTTPIQKLQLHENSSGASVISFTNNTTGDGISDGLLVGLDSTEDGLVFMKESQAIIFGTSNSERMRIHSDGHIFFGRTNQTINNSNHGMVFFDSDRLDLGRDVDATASVFQAFGNVGQFRIMGDGDAENTNNRYTGISDIKYKQNVQNASSQWDDIKDIQVRKYELIANPGVKHIGVVAQELEQICPGLVIERTVDEETGETAKSVAYSVLYMKAVKALQEAMERIETLEAKVAALEAG